MQDIKLVPNELSTTTTVVLQNINLSLIGVWETDSLDISSFYNGIITVKASVSDQAGNGPVEHITTTLIKDVEYTIIESFTYVHPDTIVRDADDVVFTADFDEDLFNATISIDFEPAGIKDES